MVIMKDFVAVLEYCILFLYDRQWLNHLIKMRRFCVMQTFVLLCVGNENCHVLQYSEANVLIAVKP